MISSPDRRATQYLVLSPPRFRVRFSRASLGSRGVKVGTVGWRKGSGNVGTMGRCADARWGLGCRLQEGFALGMG